MAVANGHWSLSSCMCWRSALSTMPAVRPGSSQGAHSGGLCRTRADPRAAFEQAPDRDTRQPVCCDLGKGSSSRGMEDEDRTETPRSYVSLYRKRAAPCLWPICGPVSSWPFTP